MKIVQKKTLNICRLILYYQQLSSFPQRTAGGSDRSAGGSGRPAGGLGRPAGGSGWSVPLPQSSLLLQQILQLF